MTVLITTTKVRPNTFVNFTPTGSSSNHSNWSGYIDCLAILLSNDELTKTTVCRWESREHFESPTLTTEQQMINNEFIQWNLNNNITVTDLIEDE